jgi:hypothetical protein
MTSNLIRKFIFLVLLPPIEEINESLLASEISVFFPTSFNNVETISPLSWWKVREPQFAHVEYLFHSKFLVFQVLKYKLKGYLMWWVFLLV